MPETLISKAEGEARRDGAHHGTMSVSKVVGSSGRRARAGGRFIDPPEPGVGELVGIRSFGSPDTPRPRSGTLLRVRVSSPDGSLVFVTGYESGSGTIPAFTPDFVTVAYEASTGREVWDVPIDGRRQPG